MRTLRNVRANPCVVSIRTTTCPYCASSLPPLSATCPTCGASLTSPALEIGAVIGGKYRVERVLGQGGFGIAYLALDTELDHRVAIKEFFPDGSTRRDGKVIPPSGMDFAQTKQKFLEEARVVQRFNHVGIVRVYGVFEGNQTAYMVMEALNGSTLTADVLENAAFPPPKPSSSWRGNSAPRSRSSTRLTCCTATSSQTTCFLAATGASC